MELGPNSEERRRVTRTRVIDSQLITVDLGDGNSGLMVDGAEWGIAVQAVAAPPVGSQRSISFTLPGSNVKISASGRIVWKDNTNQLGIHFAEISDMQRKVLRKWLEEIERETTQAMLEWDAESSGKTVVFPEQPPIEDEVKATPEPRAPEPRAPEPRAPEVAWDPFAAPKRPSREHEPEKPHQRWGALPPATKPEPPPLPAAGSELTEYEEPRYYPVTPPPTQLPEGAVAIVQAPVVTVKPVVKTVTPSTTRERFEQWVVEKHHGSKFEKVKTAVAIVLMVLGLWLFVKILPPIAAELKYDWNKFASAFSLPVIGDGSTGPFLPASEPVSSVAPVSIPSGNASENSGVPENRPTARRTGPVTSSPRRAAEAPSGVFVPSFGASSTPYRLRLPDGVAPGRLLYQVKPVYPDRARSRRPDPRVAVRAVVDTSGRVVGVQPLRGDAALTAAATQAVRQWRYEPYRVAGKPVEVETRIDIDFSALR